MAPAAGPPSSPERFPGWGGFPGGGLLMYLLFLEVFEYVFFCFLVFSGLVELLKRIQRGCS